MAKDRHLSKKHGEETRRLKIRGSDTLPSILEYPLFSFLYVHPDYCITHCNKDDKAAFADCVRIYSQIKWLEMRSSSRHSFGSEKIEKIGAPIPYNLQGRDLDFLAIRFSGRKPIVGFRDENIFYIVWVDREFNVYDHGS